LEKKDECLKGVEDFMALTTLTLSPWDAAIVLKQDGSFETSLPKINGDYIPDNVVLGAALAFALRNEDLCILIRENFERECAAGVE
jgi:hypothetical protein